jgi:hypothetical protein
MEPAADGDPEASTGAALSLMLIYVSREYRRMGEHLASKLCLLAVESVGGGRNVGTSIRKILGKGVAERLLYLEEIQRRATNQNGQISRRRKPPRK